MIQILFGVLWLVLALWFFAEGEDTNGLVALALTHAHVIHAELEGLRRS